jgi:predicted YcjX-like family ATPase
MEIKIKDYLSDEEIKDIVKEEIKRHVRQCVGDLSVSDVDIGRVFVTKLAQKLAKEGVQEIIPNFKELINAQIESQIKKITLSDFFVSSFGWSNPGNKILNGVLSDNKPLLDAKIKEIFSTVK